MAEPHSLPLSTDDLLALRTIVGISKVFSIDTLKLTNSLCVGIDDVPTIAVFIKPKLAKYAGPDIFLNRLRILETRLGSGKAQVTVKHSAAGAPVSLEIVKGRVTVDFRLAGKLDRMPAQFTGSFAHDFTLSRTELQEVLSGCKSVGGRLLTLDQKNQSQNIRCANEGETFKYAVTDSINSSAEFSFNYSIEHLASVDKILAPGADFIGRITPRGQLMVDIDTPDVSIQVFIFDVKNR